MMKIESYLIHKKRLKHANYFSKHIFEGMLKRKKIDFFQAAHTIQAHIKVKH